VNWKSAADFWAMGGYGFYVWGSYATVLAAVVIEIVLLRVRRRRAISEIIGDNLKTGKSTQIVGNR